MDVKTRGLKMIKISNPREKNFKKIHPYIKEEIKVKENGKPKKNRKTK